MQGKKRGREAEDYFAGERVLRDAQDPASLSLHGKQRQLQYNPLIEPPDCLELVPI